MSAGDAIAAVVVIGAGAGAVYMASRYRRATPAVTYVTYEPTQSSGGGGKSALLSLAAPFIGAGIDGLFSGKFGNIFGGNKRETVDQNPAQAGGIFSVGGVSRGPVSVPQTRGTTAPTGGRTALHDLIGGVEAPKGYDQVSGFIRKNDLPPKPVTKMTVNEVLAWQYSIDDKYNTGEAAGQYQYIKETLKAKRDQGVVGGNELFNKATQDRLATDSMERKGLSKYRAGQITETQFAQNLSQEWASLPAFTTDKRGRTAVGQSYYAGDGINKSHLSKNQVLAAVRGLR